jgi:hypothetical protein
MAAAEGTGRGHVQVEAAKETAATIEMKAASGGGGDSSSH